MQGTPHDVENVPPDREKKPEGEDRNPERQGPDPGSQGERTEKAENGEEDAGPPPESIPGDQGDVPNPKR